MLMLMLMLVVAVGVGRRVLFPRGGDEFVAHRCRGIGPSDSEIQEPVPFDRLAVGELGRGVAPGPSNVHHGVTSELKIAHLGTTNAITTTSTTSTRGSGRRRTGTRTRTL